jgi:hypothetical protein
MYPSFLTIADCECCCFPHSLILCMISMISREIIPVYAQCRRDRYDFRISYLPRRYEIYNLYRSFSYMRCCDVCTERILVEVPPSGILSLSAQRRRCRTSRLQGYRVQEYRLSSPSYFKCNVLRESLSVDSQTLKRRGSWVISVYLCVCRSESVTSRSCSTSSRRATRRGSSSGSTRRRFWPRRTPRSQHNLIIHVLCTDMW